MEIKSVSDFITECLCFSCRNGKAETVYYRGLNQIWPAATLHIPSIYHPNEGFIEKEREIFNEVVSVFPVEMLAQKTTVEKLILMQHYRFPTRIMDVSPNPLVGLFFACFSDGNEDATGKNGIVCRYRVAEEKIKTCDSDTVAVISNITRCKLEFPNGDCSSMSVEEFNKTDGGSELHFEICREHLHSYACIDPKHLYQVVCLRPRMNNPRIIRQEGRFFLFGVDGKSKRGCAKIPREWLLDPITIPAENKKRILDELDSMGLNEGFFYPDFEHVSRVVRSHYRKKN